MPKFYIRAFRKHEMIGINYYEVEANDPEEAKDIISGIISISSQVESFKNNINNIVKRFKLNLEEGQVLLVECKDNHNLTQDVVELTYKASDTINIDEVNMNGIVK